jgi:hypothetical protein
MKASDVTETLTMALQASGLKALVAMGAQALRDNDIEKLREIVFRLDTARVGITDEGDILATVNILKGHP